MQSFDQVEPLVKESVVKKKTKKKKTKVKEKLRGASYVQGPRQ
jgi:hypothetical protein